VLTEASSSGSDTLNFGAITTSVALNLAATAAQLVHTDRTILLSETHTFENVVGGSGDDVLTGGSGDNMLDGRVGNDTLNGFTGSDTLIGGFGNDTYLFSLATPGETDRVEESFGQGSDTLSFSANTTGITLNLSDTSVQLVHTNRSLVLSSGSTVENVLGGSGNDIIFGNSAANELSGNSGNDLLVGLAGNDTLNGGPGFDVLVGGRNQDVLQGSIGEELLISGFTKNLSGIDDDLAFLLNVQSLWAAPAAFEDRVQSLTSILGSGTTVRNDSAVDTVTSNADGSLDWLFAALTDGVTKDVADMLSLL
jgi:Ca2+-binding RTX toxin-like protein